MELDRNIRDLARYSVHFGMFQNRPKVGKLGYIFTYDWDPTKHWPCMHYFVHEFMQAQSNGQIVI
jgi:hypothetical protein